MTHFYQTVKRLEAIEGFLCGLLAIVAVLVWLGGSVQEQPRVRVLADNNSRAAQEWKQETVQTLDLSGVQSFKDVLYPPKRLWDGRVDSFWCILVKNSCYSEQDVEEPKSFFVMLWKRWFSTEKEDTYPQDGDKVVKEEG